MDYTDWEKHIEEHFKTLHDRWVRFGTDLGNGKPYKISEQKFKAVKNRVSKFLETRGKSSNAYSQGEWEALELIDMLKLCESLNEFRSIKFNDRSLNDDTIIYIPISMKEIEFLFFAIEDAVNNKIIETNNDLQKR